MGVYMQHIRILCSSPNLLTAYSVARCVETLLCGLLCLQEGRTAIQSFEMYNLNFDETWNCFRSSKCLLVDSVSMFLEFQKNLRRLSITHAFMTPPFAFRIIKAFARSRSVQTVEVLNIENYYSLDVSERIIGSQLRSVCKKCWKLREISLNYYYLSSVKVVDLCELLEESLEKLIVYMTVFDYSRDWMLITPDSWRLACQVCPRLKVSLHLEGWPRDPTASLVPSIPLVEVSVRGGQCRYSMQTIAEKLNLLLEHLSLLYSATLRNAWFDSEAATISYPDKKSLVQFLTKCRSIRTLTFSDRLMTPEFMNQVKAELSDSLRETAPVRIIPHQSFLTS